MIPELRVAEQAVLETLEYARVPLGDSTDLVDSVLVHPRYAPDAEIIHFEGFKRGRKVYVKTDAGKLPYLTFKGVGADVTKPGHMHADGWWLDQRDLDVHATWRFASPSNDPHGRSWGVMRLEEALSESESHILEDHGIQTVPNYKVNEIPQAVHTKIDTLGRTYTLDEPLAQLVGGSSTLIRMNDFPRRLSFESPYTRETLLRVRRSIAETFGVEDAKILKLDFDFALKGNSLQYFGGVSDNRYIDGSFTDQENLEVVSGANLDPSLTFDFSERTLWDSLHFFSLGSKLEYLRSLEETLDVELPVKDLISAPARDASERIVDVFLRDRGVSR